MNDEWLDAAALRLAGAAGDDPATYALSAADIEALLDLARVAAHESGDRKNAPLVCYLAGLARGWHPEQALAAVAVRAAGSA